MNFTNFLDFFSLSLYSIFDILAKEGTDVTLGQIIKEYRAANKVSQDVIAERSGLSKAYISILERNINPTTGEAPIASLKTIN